MTRSNEYSAPACEPVLIDLESGVLSDSGQIDQPKIGGPGEIGIE